MAGQGFGTFGGGDFSSAFSERAEIYDTSASTDCRVRHRLGRPPQLLGRLCRIQFAASRVRAVRAELHHRFDLRPGLGEAAKDMKDFPLLPLFVRKAPGVGPGCDDESHDQARRARGARICSERRHQEGAGGDHSRRRASLGIRRHGRARLRSGQCRARLDRHRMYSIVSPISRASIRDSGPLRYRVSHHANLWRSGTPSKLEQRVLEGDAKLSVS